MTDQIAAHIQDEFSAAVLVRAQQKKTRMGSIVPMFNTSGEFGQINRNDTVRAIEITSRHQDTVGQDITQDTRWVKVREFVTTLFLDKKDDFETLTDPSKGYIDAVVRSLNVKKDQIITAAAFGTMVTGRNKDGTITFANDDGLTITAAGVGLTYEKILSVSENFINNDVGTDEDERMYLAITGQQHTNMMKELELTSGDFSRNSTMEGGKIINVLGMDIVMFSGTNSDAIISKTSTTRDCIAFSQLGLQAFVHNDIILEVDRRADKNGLKQIQATLMIGAGRADGRRVQKLQCTEV